MPFTAFCEPFSPSDAAQALMSFHERYEKQEVEEEACTTAGDILSELSNDEYDKPSLSSQAALSRNQALASVSSESHARSSTAFPSLRQVPTACDRSFEASEQRTWPLSPSRTFTLSSGDSQPSSAPEVQPRDDIAGIRPLPSLGALGNGIDPFAEEIRRCPTGGCLVCSSYSCSDVRNSINTPCRFRYHTNEQHQAVFDPSSLLTGRQEGSCTLTYGIPRSAVPNGTTNEPP